MPKNKQENNFALHVLEYLHMCIGKKKCITAFCVKACSCKFNSMWITLVHVVLKCLASHIYQDNMEGIELLQSCRSLKWRMMFKDNFKAWSYILSQCEWHWCILYWYVNWSWKLLLFVLLTKDIHQEQYAWSLM